jgi:hypothetical protein
MQMNIKVIFFSTLFLLSDFAVAYESFEKGSWEIVSDTSCSETHSFDGDSLVKVKSGEQRLTKGYFISKVDKTEFFEFKTIVTDNNGKPDCLERHDSKIGSELNLYFKFNENKNEMHFYVFPDEEGNIDVYLRKIN